MKDRSGAERAAGGENTGSRDRASGNGDADKTDTSTDDGGGIAAEGW